MTRPTLDRLHRIALVVSFAAVVCAPVVDNLFGLDPSEPRVELRPLASAADIVGASSPAELSGALNRVAADHFGFRNSLIEAGARLQVQLLGVSSNPLVVLGREGWMFLAGDGALASYRAKRPLGPGELRRVVRIFERRADWFAKRDIHYTLAIVPNKYAIATEFLPADLPAPSGPSRFEQLRQALAARDLVDVVDLRPVLRETGRKEQVYYALDAHWNPAGAFAAYTAVAHQLRQRFPAWTPLERDAFEQQSRPLNPHVASLPRMLGLPLDPNGRVMTLTPRFPLRARSRDDAAPFEQVERGGVGSVFGSRLADAAGPRTAVIRDSFANQMLLFLSESLPDVTYHWPVVPSEISLEHRDAIERSRPDWVLHLFSERTLEWGLADLRVFGRKDDDIRDGQAPR